MVLKILSSLAARSVVLLTLVLPASPLAAAVPGPTGAADGVALSAPGGAAPAASDSGEAAAMLAKAEAAGSLPVIVELGVPLTPPHELSPPAAEAQTGALRSVQARVLARLGADVAPAGLDGASASAVAAPGIANVKVYDYSPLLAVTADADRLAQLLSDPDVVRVHEDGRNQVALQQSIPLIDADKAYALGADGTGWTVAVLDTGMNTNHVMLAGRVVSEACYSTTNAQQGTTSLCPGGASSSTATGSAMDCELLEGCGHGTHVASTAAGKVVSYNNGTINGVAKGATIIGIKVFSKTNQGSVTAFDSDMISGLERVYALRNNYKIAAVNMSIGGGAFSSYCDTKPIKTIIDTLLGVNIATVIATQNQGYNGYISQPSCVSSAIAVGSTDKNDQVSSFSNHSNLVDLMAPGGKIVAAHQSNAKTLCNTCMGELSGTSMATPHVTGTWAVLRQKVPNATVAQVLSALASTGVNVTRAGVTKPRIDVDDALNKLIGGGKPPAATLVSPSGTVTDTTPTYVWNAVQSSTWYQIWVNNAGVSKKVNQWVTAAQASCAGGTGHCSYTPSTILSNGASAWWIQTWNSAGAGPWSAGKSFTVSVSATPGAATLIAPSGTISDTTPTYSWNAVSAATYYYLWVNSGGVSGKIKQWFTAAAAGCGSGTGTCAVTPSTVLASGSGSWWIQTWNTHGYGPWSAGKTFSIVSGPPPATTMTAPSGTITDTTPTYSWTAVAASTWYQLWVNDAAKTQKILQWYTAAQSGCASGTGGCSVTPTTALAPGAATAWARTWNSHGNGPWSAARTFTVAGGGGTPCVFNDQFNSSAAGWSELSGDWYYDSSYIYSYGVADNWAAAQRATTCNALDYTARLWRAGCQTCGSGLLVRSDTAVSGNLPNNAYFFLYTADRRCSVWKRTGGGAMSALKSWGAAGSCSAVIAGSNWNVLRAIANGSSLRFYVNGTQVWSGTDTALTSGRPGLAIYSDASSGNGLWADYATSAAPAGGAGASGAERLAAAPEPGSRYGGPDQAPLD